MDTNYKTLLKNKTAIIFDLDGTLLNSEPLHVKAITQVLLSFQEKGLLPDKFSIPSEENFATHFHGLSDDKVLNKLFPNEEIKFDLNEFIEQKSNAFEVVLKEMPLEELKAQLLPGIEKFLENKFKENITLGLVTASSEKIGRLILDKLNFTQYFKVLVFRENTFFTKPSPSPYFLALRQLELHQSEVVIFEDSTVGLKSALETGSDVIQVTKFVRPKKDYNLLKINSI